LSEIFTNVQGRGVSPNGGREEILGKKTFLQQWEKRKARGDLNKTRKRRKKDSLHVAVKKVLTAVEYRGLTLRTSPEIKNPSGMKEDLPILPTRSSCSKGV